MTEKQILSIGWKKTQLVGSYWFPDEDGSSIEGVTLAVHSFVDKWFAKHAGVELTDGHVFIDIGGEMVFSGPCPDIDRLKELMKAYKIENYDTKTKS